MFVILSTTLLLMAPRRRNSSMDLNLIESDSFVSRLFRKQFNFVRIAAKILRKLWQRWVRQLPMLAFGTYYFLYITPHQALHNYTDIAAVWYTGPLSMRKNCAIFPNYIASHLFVWNFYAPLTGDPCHNNSIFEAQFHVEEKQIYRK